MVPDVSQRLIQLHSNLVECEPLEEMQFERIALVFGQGGEESLNGSAAGQMIEGIVLSPPLRACINQVRSAVQIYTSIEVARLKVATLIDRPMVGHLYDPGPNRTLRSVKHLAFTVDEQKDFLKQVIGLGSISQYSTRNRAHQPGITLKQASQRLHVANADPGQQVLIRSVYLRLRGFLRWKPAELSCEG